NLTPFKMSCIVEQNEISETNDSLSLKGKAYKIIDEHFGALKKIWDQLGMDEENISLRNKTVLTHLQNMLQEMVKEEEVYKESIIKKIEKKAKLYMEVCTELGREVETSEESWSILAVEKFFRDKYREVHEEKSKIMNAVRRDKEQEEDLATKLGEASILMSLSTIPSAEDIARLKSRIEYLRVELVKRTESFQEKRRDIKTFMDVLKTEPTTEFEKMVINEEIPSFPLSIDTMYKVEKIYDLYKDRVDRARTESRKIKIELATLMDRLELDDQQTSHIKRLLDACGVTSEDIKSLRTALEGLRAIKRKHASKLVDRLKSELDRTWEDLFFSDEQKKDFSPFADDPEVLLEMYEEELKKLEIFKEETKEALDKFRQHQELWRKLEDFEYKSHDTNRYTNRGGALLLEEKERKRLNREIPRLEREVARAVQIYDEDHQQTPLLVYGKRVVNYIENQRMRFEEEKEKEKQFRALMRNKQIEEEATLGSRPITPRSARKRPGVSTMSDSKKPRLGAAMSLKGSNSKLRKVDSSRAITDTQRSERCMTQSGASASSSLSCSYSDFKENLELKGRRDNNTRSSIASRRKSKSTPNLTRLAATSPRRPARAGALFLTPSQSTSMLLRSRLPSGRTPVTSKLSSKHPPSRRFLLS
ncbi:hypothetical protein QYM36_010094, partial [Artemia franciscana]